MKLFDDRPIKLAGGFLLKDRHVDFSRATKATERDWQTGFEVVLAHEESGPLWVGDFWNWGKEHIEKDRLIQLLAEIGVDVKMSTLDNRGSVARKASQAARDLAPSYSHLRVVSSLPPDEQVAVLTIAAEQNLDEAGIIALKKSRKRAAVLSGRAVL